MDSGRAYCICKSNDAGRFMIGCDKCNTWYHGDCVKISAQRAKAIKRFYCPPCQKLNPSLEIQFKDDAPPPVVTVETKKPTEFRCGQCIGCFRRENCGRCVPSCTGGAAPCKQRRCVQAPPTTATATTTSSAPKRKSNQQPQNKRGRPLKGGVVDLVDGKTTKATLATKKAKIATTSTVTKADGLTTSLGGTRSSAKAYRAFLKDAGLLGASDDETSAGTGNSVGPSNGIPPKSVQCVGPGCVQAARNHSKYCSDECGLRLARQRLIQLVPSRYEAWRGANGAESAAEQRQNELMSNFKQEREAARRRLVELDNEERALNEWLETVNKMKTENDNKQKSVLTPDDEPTNSGGGGEDQTIYCFVCGIDTGLKQAAKHMNRCFTKLESQSSYGSAFQAVSNPYNLFCDAYNKTNNTYCKRLRVICPEHGIKETGDGEPICGYRVKHTLPYEQKCCMVLRKNCQKHLLWERTARALIDMQRLSMLLKLDELFEQAKVLQTSSQSRCSVLALLMHQTIDHRLSSPQAK